MKSLLKITLLIATSIAFVACSSTINTVEPKNSTAVANVVADKRITTDSTLASNAQIRSVVSARVGGLLKIQVEVYNATSSPQNVNYQFSWIDKNAMAVLSPASAWQTIVLEGKEVRYISAVAPSENVVDFTLKLLSDVREY